MRYHERQHFHRGLLVFLLLVALLSGVTAVVATVQTGRLVFAVVLIPVALVPALLGFVFALETQVEGNELRVRLVPLPFRRIPLADVASAEVRTYRPLREYGGWGIRWGRAGMAYNARGNRGVQLVLKDGRRVLIGSQEPERLLAALGTPTPE